MPRLVVDVLERQLDLVGSGGLQVLGVLQPSIPRLFEFRSSLLLTPADLIDSLVDHLYDMKLVERVFDTSNECSMGALSAPGGHHGLPDPP